MKILKQLSLYTMVGVIGAGINFFIMPILSHYLKPADYGLLSLFNTYVTILMPIVSVSAYSLLNVDYFKQKNKTVFAQQFTSIQLIPIFNTALLGILTWLFYGNFVDDLELAGTGIRWGYIMLLLTLLNIFVEQFIQFLVLQKKPGMFVIFSLLKVSVELSLTFYFIVFRGWNWEGRMYSWLITSVLFFLLGFIYFYRIGYIQAPVKWQYIREGLVFGAPLVLHGVGKFVVNQSDRLFIVKMVSLAEAGIYNIGYTVGTLVMVAIAAFFNFYTPFLMERLSNLQGNSKLQIVKMNYFYIIGCLAMLLLVMVFSRVLFNYFIDKRYMGGVKYVFWVALGYCFWGGYMLFSGFIFFTKKNRILAWLALFNVLTNLLFNYYFITWFGALGAAYATALSFFLLLVIVAIIAHRLVPLPWKEFKQVRAVSLT
jgi:O-antigen/teichoic acid export membrane protein